jgi:hypothetical protein
MARPKRRSKNGRKSKVEAPRATPGNRGGVVPAVRPVAKDPRLVLTELFFDNVAANLCWTEYEAMRSVCRWTHSRCWSSDDHILGLWGASPVAAVRITSSKMVRCPHLPTLLRSYPPDGSGVILEYASRFQLRKASIPLPAYIEAVKQAAVAAPRLKHLSVDIAGTAVKLYLSFWQSLITSLSSLHGQTSMLQVLKVTGGNQVALDKLPSAVESGALRDLRELKLSCTVDQRLASKIMLAVQSGCPSLQTLHTEHVQWMESAPQLTSLIGRLKELQAGSLYGDAGMQIVREVAVSGKNLRHLSLGTFYRLSAVRELIWHLLDPSWATAGLPELQKLDLCIHLAAIDTDSDEANEMAFLHSESVTKEIVAQLQERGVCLTLH